MDKRLEDIALGREDNYLLPFLWVQNGERDCLAQRIEAVRRSGARAFCVESRTHAGFCQEEWWGDMAVILETAKRLDMKVWILDDKHFPTGYANGLVAAKYPERRKWQLLEHHLDVLGPMRDCALLLPPDFAQDALIGVAAYPRGARGEDLLPGAVTLTANVHGDYLFWDVPEGLWRVFFFYKSRRGVSRGQEDYIHLIDKESVQVLIEAVYAPHYAHFSDYFGNTIAGFFSDEPSMGNAFFNPTKQRTEMKNHRLGMPGLALPWSDAVRESLVSSLGGDIATKLAALWYPMEGAEGAVRFAYMDTVTRLYRDAFSRQLGDWCRAHGVAYIGHIIEDMNAHARLGCSAGHYFRGLDGQDMSGMDIVLHQIIPGFAEHTSAAICSGGMVDPEFYHYVLAKLCASMAQLNPKMKGRAVCENFGAYGWAEGVPMMKWLTDHLLVRGINHFVPHAFSPFFPNPDCPPHFDADGADPQFPGFTKLMGYINKAAHLLYDSVHMAEVAILYHAEGEWMGGDACMLTQKPAKALCDAHIPFEIVPMDYILDFGSVADGSLRIHRHAFRHLIIPYAPELPVAYWETIAQLEKGGVEVLMAVEDEPSPMPPLQTVPLSEIANALKAQSIGIAGNHPLLRIGHFRRDGLDIFMLFNESITEHVDTVVQFPCAGAYRQLDLLNDETFGGICGKEGVPIKLTPYASTIVLFGSEAGPAKGAATQSQAPITLSIEWDISLWETGISDTFLPFTTGTSLPNITGPGARPDFSGVIRYEGSFLWNEGAATLDLGEVGQTAHVKLNGEDLGLRICKPYRYDASLALREGVNKITVEVANTLVHRCKDRFSAFLPIPPSGLLGPVRLSKSE